MFWRMYNWRMHKIKINCSFAHPRAHACIKFLLIIRNRYETHGLLAWCLLCFIWSTLSHTRAHALVRIIHSLESNRPIIDVIILQSVVVLRWCAGVTVIIWSQCSSPLWAGINFYIYRCTSLIASSSGKLSSPRICLAHFSPFTPNTYRRKEMSEKFLVVLYLCIEVLCALVCAYVCVWYAFLDRKH